MSALFHQDLVVAVLGSGSSGNSTYIGDGRHGVLIDCGLSTKQVASRLGTLGLAGTGPLGAPVDAVLITHEHSDHVGAAAVLDRRLATDEQQVPFYMTPGTRSRLNRKCTPGRIEHVTPGTPFRVGSLTIEPILIPHDTPEPVAYVVATGTTRIGVITDLGRSTRLVEAMLASLDVAIVEFNHDVEMLMDGAYPWQLKQRIRSNFGHLSNDQACGLLATGASSRLKHLILGHLSEENNRPEKAAIAAAEGLYDAKLSRVKVHIASPTEPHRIDLPVSVPALPPRVTRARPVVPEVLPAQGQLFATVR